MVNSKVPITLWQSTTITCLTVVSGDSNGLFYGRGVSVHSNSFISHWVSLGPEKECIIWLMLNIAFINECDCCHKLSIGLGNRSGLLGCWFCSRGTG